jgi:hypothetical protein
MSWATADLNEEELKRFRAVQRLRHGITVAVYDLGGVNVFGPRFMEPNIASMTISAPAQSMRVVFWLGGQEQRRGHSWAEIVQAPDHAAYQVRGRGRRGGWITRWKLTIPLP